MTAVRWLAEVRRSRRKRRGDARRAEARELHEAADRAVRLGALIETDYRRRNGGAR